MRALAGYRGVLEIREARVLIGASAVSQIGDWLYNAALLGYVLAVTHSAVWVGAATLCRLLPYVVLAPFGGALADRHPRRRVLVTGSVLRMLIMIVLAVIVGEHGPVALTVAIVALSSACGSAERPAALSLLPRLVGEGRIGQANALLHTVQDAAVVIGPGIGALILAVASPAAAFIANAATFAVAALLFATLGQHRTRRAGAEQRSAGVAAAVSTARSTRFVIPIAVVVAMVEFTYGAQTVQLVVYASHDLRLGTGGYGLLLAASGAGGILSATVNGQLATTRRLVLVVTLAAILACGTQIVYANSSILALALVVSVVGGATLVSCEVVAETVLARVTPRDTLGRIAGLFDSSSIAAMVGGAVFASLLVSGTSLRLSFWILGGLTAVVALLFGVGGLRGLDEVSEQRSAALASRLAILEALPITQGTPRLVLEQLASSSQLIKLPSEVDVVVEGSPAHAFYAISEGSVVVRRGDEILAHLGAGESFGERGLLDNAPRNATVTTEQDTILLRIEGDVLLELLEQAPVLSTALDRSHGGPASAESAPTPSPVDDPTWVPA